MQFQFRTNDDDGTSGVIDALAEQVLTEPSAFALEHVAERFERAISGAGDGAAVTAIVEQSVDRFLQHALFVADDDVRRFELEQILEPIVAIDDAAIKIVQIAGRESSAFERNERTQIRRDDRQHIENHPIGTRMRVLEALHQFGPFRQFLANLFALGGAHRLIQFFVELVQIDFRQQFFHCFRAHAGDKIFAVLLLRFAILNFVQQLRLRKRRLARIDDDVVFVIDDALELTRAHVEHQSQTGRHAFIKPDVRNRHGQFDMAHAFATHARQRHFHAATIADDALVFDALVFSAGTFPIARRSKNAFAEKAALLRLEGAVIDRLRIFDFAFAPGAHRVARGDADRDLLKTNGALFTH